MKPGYFHKWPGAASRAREKYRIDFYAIISPSAIMGSIVTEPSRGDIIDLNITSNHREYLTMGKEQKSNKEEKKKPTMTPKEKKAAKKNKKESRDRIDSTR